MSRQQKRFDLTPPHEKKKTKKEANFISASAENQFDMTVIYKQPMH